jgi:hypothetical protein
VTSQDWGDPAKQYADYVMGIVQTIAGSTPNGTARNAAPYYVFGLLYEQNQTPLTPLPAVQWRQSDGHFDYTREMGGGDGMTGSLGSFVMDYEVKIYGTNRAMVFNEFLYMLQAILTTQQPNPPIGDIRSTWITSKAEHNQKEVMQVTFTAPVLIPLPIDAIASINYASSSIEMPTLSGSHGYPPVTGSYQVVRYVVVS